MKQKQINLQKLLKNRKKGWVGISSDFQRVVLQGKTLKKVRAQSKELDEKLYFFPTGETYSHFVGV